MDDKGPGTNRHHHPPPIGQQQQPQGRRHQRHLLSNNGQAANEDVQKPQQPVATIREAVVTTPSTNITTDQQLMTMFQVSFLLFLLVSKTSKTRFYKLAAAAKVFLGVK